MTEPERLFEELNAYLLRFPKYNSHGSNLDCEDVKIVNTIVAPNPVPVNDVVYINDPVDLITQHRLLLERLIEAERAQGLVCLVRCYPEIKGNPNGLRIRTRLQFGKAGDILLKLLPPAPEEIFSY